MTAKATLVLLVLFSMNCFGQRRSIPLEITLTSSNNPVGKVIFRETMKGKLNVDISVQALTRGLHAVHIHQYPSCDPPDFSTAGKHFNPDFKQHGWLNPAGHHAGDFPQNIEVDADGNGHLNVTLDELDLDPNSSHSILGRSIVIHERGDDMKTDPSGESGNRIACGVIRAK
jgi:Cu-Zn family superoxide dismutase